MLKLQNEPELCLVPQCPLFRLCPVMEGLTVFIRWPETARQSGAASWQSADTSSPACPKLGSHPCPSICMSPHLRKWPCHPPGNRARGLGIPSRALFLSSLHPTPDPIHLQLLGGLFPKHIMSPSSFPCVSFPILVQATSSPIWIPSPLLPNWSSCHGPLRHYPRQQARANLFKGKPRPMSPWLKTLFQELPMDLETNP